jgi:hypothetical protein
MEILNSITDFVSDHIALILALLFVAWKSKELYLYFVLQPLRGGNGVVQMDEFAKYCLVWILIYMVYREGQSEQHYYDVSIFWAMVIGIFLIAGVKEIVKIIPSFSNKTDEQ